MLKTKRIMAVVLTLCMLISLFTIVPTVQAKINDKNTTQADAETVSSSVSKVTSPSDFSWDNASVYFLLTDRFYNGNTSNDHSYGRGLDQNGQVVEAKTDAAYFHGGDFAGITTKINEGYFDSLGVNALWISAPYEQIHGYCIGGSGSNSFPHYAYHGYYALDFSQTDANFGTEEEFEKMVDTAHEHGIRIVLDIVMNHVGYNTLADMSQYGFGTVKSGWESGYYSAALNDTTYHQYIDYKSNKDDWAKWWGSSWLRAGLAGYTEGSGDLMGSQEYLPDVKTESSEIVDIPEVLKTKWTQENTLASKQAELDNYFSTTGKSKTVRNYLVFWLSQWVEKYGVDGFRCDTAKHVELDSWKALKEQCLDSLETWRKNNPTKPGADWDESFWMTGECFPHYLTYDGYYTNGGFDSMINFSFNRTGAFNDKGKGVPDVNSINETYEEYAEKLNTNDNFNVLTYLSSHDTSLCRTDLIYQGSAFQLLPGGIQIFYGDETNRPLLTDKYARAKDHALRSDMNWDSIDNDILQHWQKVGTFRNKHISVGAGSHTSLTATSGAAFARTYDKDSVSDKIVACIGAEPNTNVTITLNGAFEDGTVLRNTYDNASATVSDGKVTFNSGANGTILLEEGSQLIGDVDLDNDINVKDATLIQLYAANLNTLDETQLIAADVDNSGNVDVKDATYIQLYCANLSVDGINIGQYK
ncbi:MAG: alpha-amylase [Ruminococcus sp.]|nr:alpha-amylase [Ruminococcus sp.]